MYTLLYNVDQEDAMETILALFNQFQEYSKVNPVISGIVGLWGVSVFTFFMRNVPLKVYTWILDRFKATITVDNYRDNVFQTYLNWIDSNLTPSILNRDFVTSSLYPADITLGYTQSVYWYKKFIPILVSRSEEKTLDNAIKEKLHITVIWPTKSILKSIHAQILDNVIKAENNHSKTHLRLWQLDTYEWVSGKTGFRKRDMSNVVIDKSTKIEVISHIERFKAEKEVATKVGIPHYTGILLYGPPGTGKTSLIKAIATYFGADIYNLNLTQVKEDNITVAFSMEGSSRRSSAQDEPYKILAIEDIDAFGANMSREDQDSTRLSLSSILNAMDGMSAVENRIMIATTNNIEALDAALTRKGRFDLVIELGYTTNEMLEEYGRLYEPDFKLPIGFQIKDKVPMCDVQYKFFKNRDRLNEIVMEFAK